MALRAEFIDGSAWGCTIKKPTDKVPTCEAMQIVGEQSTTTASNQVRLFTTQQETSGFDGAFSLGKISASPPAIPAP
jgi:hypothetical protein